MRDNWDDMRLFLAVARAESLSGAARVLRVDPATIGRRIARLEEGLSGPLFLKSPQGYALTDLGQRMAAHATEAEGAMMLAREEGQGVAEGLTGQIRIGAPDGCANFVLPQVCRTLREENPGLELQILALPRVVNLSRREADMAITVSPPTAGSLVVQKVSAYSLGLAASPDYLAGAPRIDSLTDLSDHPQVGYIQDMIFDDALDYLSETNQQRVDLASNSSSVQVNMLRAGAGVGIVHRFAIAAAGGLAPVLEQAFSLTRAFYLVRHGSERRAERMSRLARRLGELMRAEIARLEAQV